MTAPPWWCGSRGERRGQVRGPFAWQQMAPWRPYGCGRQGHFPTGSKPPLEHRDEKDHGQIDRTYQRQGQQLLWIHRPSPPLLQISWQDPVYGGPGRNIPGKIGQE